MRNKTKKHIAGVGIHNHSLKDIIKVLSKIQKINIKDYEEIVVSHEKENGILDSFLTICGIRPETRNEAQKRKRDLKREEERKRLKESNKIVFPEEYKEFLELKKELFEEG